MLPRQPSESVQGYLGRVFSGVYNWKIDFAIQVSWVHGVSFASPLNLGHFLTPFRFIQKGIT